MAGNILKITNFPIIEWKNRSYCETSTKLCMQTHLSLLFAKRPLDTSFFKMAAILKDVRRLY